MEARDIEAEVKLVLDWAKTGPHGNTLTWTPPCPVLITGIELDEPAVVNIVLCCDQVIAWRGHHRHPCVCLPERPLSFITLPAQVLIPGEEMRLTFADDATGSAKLHLAEDVLRDWITRDRAERAKHY